jgi:hypothetical protein
LKVREVKTKKKCDLQLKETFFFSALFGWSFGFALQRQFVELDKALL